MSGPQTKAARQARIVDLVQRASVRSQSELADLLRADGFPVTQGTLSRDLTDVGAVRVRGVDGDLHYALTDADATHPARARERLHRLCAEVLTSAEGSGSLVVAKTTPGAAQYLASAIDKVGWAAVLGTVAGDDSLLIVARAKGGGPALAEELLSLGSGKGDTS